MTDTDEATGKPTAEAMEQVNSKVSTYVCGTCGHTETAEWRVHQAHYESHQK